MNILYHYFVSGVIDAGIAEDGGPQCYAQIPKLFHVVAALLSAFSHTYFIYRWNRKQRPKGYLPLKSLNLLELIAGIISIISLILTIYYKIITRKGMFIFNPCHVTLLMMIIMLLAEKNTFFLQDLHTYWTAWIYGAILALGSPHLQGISNFQVFLYYLQHLLIFPLGPLLLIRRYGFVKPNFINHIVSFASMCVYQLVILLPLSLITTVNLNYVLCHTPADPTFQHIGYFYFLAAIFVLNVFSLMGRICSYLIVLPFLGKEKKE